MTPDVSERNFEESIERGLLKEFGIEPDKKGELFDESFSPYGAFEPGGYQKINPEKYDRSHCFIPDDLFSYIYASQAEEWQKFKNQYKSEAKDRFIQRLSREVEKRGLIDVLRKGIKANGCKFKLVFFRPVSGLNESLQKLYKSNIFSVIRQLKYSTKNEKSVDLGLFLNGLPIFTAELKEEFKGQDVTDAVWQYKKDRDPREPLFSFGRCLAHFAVDPDYVYLTTKIEGMKTDFLPFNQGYDSGAGNPPSWKGFATAYLWENIWSKDSVLNLVEHFVHVVEEEDEMGEKTGKSHLLFPRFHQLDSVRRLIADAASLGPGQRYLIQHSAGSGKSNSIAWLAHQLSTLHNYDDKRVFDSVIVISDRRVIDRQLQKVVLQFEQTLGVVENIEKTSRQLKQALEEGKNIIVTTLQKFPIIVEEIISLPGKKFAVIIDEAHSSQSGESTKSLKTVLSVKSLEEAEKEESEAVEEDLEDRIVAEMKSRGLLPNVSYFAFTATPKTKTLELFGTKREDGKYEPFSLYTMRQAIEEKFILDVLENYTTYKTYFHLLKTIEDDPRYDRKKANYLLRSFVELHRDSIEKKVQIMIDDFVNSVMDKIGGKAKAMIVTRSRLHAVRYKFAVDEYIKELNLPLKALVAFSGEVNDGGIKYTEAGLNGFPEKQTAEAFKRDEFRIMVVAYKFQTGFDQPLLHTMYVDQKLGGVKAVQTLSRLNRIYPGKEETRVLDFINGVEAIQKAFEPYYDTTLLGEGTDPNLLYDRENDLREFHLFDHGDVEKFSKIFFSRDGTADQLHAALSPAIERFEEASDEDKASFRGALIDYLRLYSFLSQIVPFADSDLEKLYQFGRLLLRKLPKLELRLPKDIQEKIDMDSYRVQKIWSGKIGLEKGVKDITPQTEKMPVGLSEEELEHLSRIIRELNERFGTDFTDEDKIFIEQLESRLSSDPGLAASLDVNPPENARLTFDLVVNDLLQEMIDTNFKFYKQITDNSEFGKMLFDWLFERYINQSKSK